MSVDVSDGSRKGYIKSFSDALEGLNGLRFLQDVLFGHVGDLGEPCDEVVGLWKVCSTGFTAIASAFVVEIDFISVNYTMLNAS